MLYSVSSMPPGPVTTMCTAVRNTPPSTVARATQPLWRKNMALDSSVMVGLGRPVCRRVGWRDSSGLISLFAAHEVGVSSASVAGYQIVVVFEFGEFAISLQFMQRETQLAK